MCAFVLSMGLALAPAAFAASDAATASPVPPQVAQDPGPAPQQAETAVPPQRAQVQGTFNPNAVPPWSVYRNGDGAVIDPQYGLPVPGYEANEGF